MKIKKTFLSLIIAVSAALTFTACAVDERGIGGGQGMSPIQSNLESSSSVSSVTSSTVVSSIEESSSSTGGSSMQSGQSSNVSAANSSTEKSINSYSASSTSQSASSSTPTSASNQQSSSSIDIPTIPEEKMNILVAYFSATNTTEKLAEYAAEILGADLYEITPAVPYTDADLAYYTNGRADKEQADNSCRPDISGSVSNMDDYKTVLIGYPIWHRQAPRIISTFLESYDFSGKTIVPFCTSHSSGIGSSDTDLHGLAVGADWLSGKRFSGSSNKDDISEWIKTLNIEQTNSSPNSSVAQFNLSAGSNGNAPTVKLNSGFEMPIAGIGTYSLHGETCVNSIISALEQGVRLIDTAYMYGNEEEVGEAIRKSKVPREEIFVITKIYPGEQFQNPEKAIQDALDKLDIGYIDMMLLHHPGANDVNAYKAMEKFVERGKIRSLGLSNWYIEEIDDFITQVNIKPALVQNEIHPYYQEQKVIPYMHDLGIVMQAWYPLGGRGHQSELLNDKTILEIAQNHGKSAAQVILRWDLQNGVVVIPGSSNPAHILENISLFDFELTDEEMEKIAALDRNEKHDWY